MRITLSEEQQRRVEAARRSFRDHEAVISEVAAEFFGDGVVCVAVAERTNTRHAPHHAASTETNVPL